MTTKKYFFFDMDNTLLAGKPSKYVPESAAKALELLRAQGHFLAIATGRSEAMAKEYCLQYGFDNLVTDGGNGLTIEGTCLGIEPLDRNLVMELLEELEAKDIPYAVSVDNSQVRISKDQRFLDITNADWYMKTQQVPEFDFHALDIIYKVYVACEKEKEDSLQGLKKLPFARYHDTYIFVEPDDKGHGIRRMMEHFQAPLEDVVVFGDGKNDLKMFCPEWTSIAMGNGIEELKKKADYVTASAEDDGIWKACVHYGWIREE